MGMKDNLGSFLAFRQWLPPYKLDNLTSRYALYAVDEITDGDDTYVVESYVEWLYRIYKRKCRKFGVEPGPYDVAPPKPAPFEVPELSP